MKKALKIFLIIFIIGVILGGIGIAIRGFKPFSISYTNGKLEVNDGQKAQLTLDKTEVDAFTNIDAHIAVGDVNIIPSDKYAIEYALDASKVTYEVKDGTLVVDTQESNKVSMDFSFSSNNYLNIYVPADSEFAKASIRGDVGEINIDSLKFDSLEIISNVGDVTLTKCTVNTSNIVVNTGDLKLTNCALTSSDIESDTGDVTATNLSVNTKLKVDSSVGDVVIALKSDKYNLDLKTSVGDIKVNGKEMDDGVSQSYKEDNGGAKITLSTSTGDIELNY